MDPRHPEQAIPRMEELFKQYKRVMSDMAKCGSSAKLGALEREGGLVVQELCLVAPRLHDAMIAISRESRKAISRGVVPIEQYVAPNQAEVYIAEPKPIKKSTRKKKVEE